MELHAELFRELEGIRTEMKKLLEKNILTLGQIDVIVEEDQEPPITQNSANLAKCEKITDIPGHINLL